MPGSYFTPPVVDKRRKKSLLGQGLNRSSWKCRTMPFSSNSNSNSNDNICDALIVALREFTRFIWPEQHERQAAADSWTIPAVGLRIRFTCRQLQYCACHLHLLLITTQPES